MVNPKTVTPGHATSGPVCLILLPDMTVEYRCDAPRDIVRLREIAHGTPLGPQMVKITYLRFLGPDLVDPKPVIPGHATFGPV